jgi:hypothetical protein
MRDASRAARWLRTPSRPCQLLRLEPLRPTALEVPSLLEQPGLLSPKIAAALTRDFPPVDHPGFHEIHSGICQGSFRQLMRDLENPALGAAVGERMGLSLEGRPQVLSLCRWMPPKQVRAFAHAPEVLCRAFLYLCPRGDIRLVRESHEGRTVGVYHLTPAFGTLVGLKEMAAWHAPSIEERRVVQILWLKNWQALYRRQEESHALLGSRHLLMAGHAGQSFSGFHH